MADTRLEPVLRHLRTLAAPPADGEAADAALLERLARRRDQAAYEELVRRHGPLVWRVCRRLLTEPGRAEDAFQATLLVLWQRAGSVRRPGSLASWLHGVAYRIARRAGAERGRERPHSHQAENPVGLDPDPAHEAAWRELGRLIEEELHGLPEKYRLPLLLTYWRGLTNEQAARELGWRPGTFKARLVRARELLHARLTARGVTLPAGVVTLLLVPGPGAEAAVPANAARAVLAGGAGRGVSAEAAALARGAAFCKVKVVAFVSLALAAAVGAGVIAQSRSSQRPSAKGPAQGAESPRPAEGKRLTTDRHGDALPEGAIARLGTLHLRGVRGSLAFSPDGKWLAAATGPAGEVITLFNIATGRADKRLGARTTLQRLVFSPDGSRLACSDNSPGSQVFDAATGKRLFTVKGSDPAFTDGGKTLVTVERGPAPPIYTWDALTGNPLRQWPTAKPPVAANPPAHHSLVMAVAANKPVAALVDRSSRDVVQVRDLNRGTTLRSIRLAHEDWQWLTLAPDGKTFATAGRAAVHQWDVGTGREIRSWRQRADGPPAFSPDGARLAWTGYDERVGIARLWTVTRDEAAPRAVGAPVNNMQPPCFSPDGKVLAVVTDGHAVELRQVADGKEVRPLDAHAGPVYGLAFTADGRHVVSRARDGVFAWEALTGRLLRRTPDGERAGEYLETLLPDGRLLTAERTADPTNSFFRVREASTGREVLRVQGRPDAGHPAVAPGGRYAGLGGERDGGFSVLDLQTGRWRYRLDPRDAHFEPKLSADGDVLAWHPRVTGPPEIHVRRHSTGKTLIIKGLPQSMDRARTRMSPDGRWLVVPNEQGFLGRWDLLNGKEATPLPGVQRTVWEITWSPDSRVILASGTASPRGVIDREARRDVRAWDAVTGRRLPHLDVEGNPQCILFSPDGRTVLIGDREEIRLREVATGQERGRLPGHHATWVSALAVSEDGRLLASGGDDSQVLVWDLTGRAPDGRWRTERLTPEQRAAAWGALAGADARAAYGALWLLAADPEGTAALLRERLRPAPAADGAQVQRLLAELNSGKFAVRDKASAELGRLGEAAEPALRKALDGRPSEELRRRLLKLLERLEAVPSAERLRELRAVEVLEQIGTAAAVRELARLADGAPEARLTREARAARERLARRLASSP
jgi:RNA polymerase sigma factor (sigma-70 family)